MDVYFNELSILPRSNTVEDARKKIITLIQTMKALKQYDFNVLKTHSEFYLADLGSGYSFTSFINDTTVPFDVKTLFMSIVQSPFIEDDDSNEAEMFILNNFETVDHLGNLISPEGIAISYVCEVPTISISGFELWDKESVRLKITANNSGDNVHHDIINISNVNSINNQNFLDWIQEITINIELNSHENILKIFSEDEYQFDPRAIAEIISWYYNDKRYLIRIKKLIEDIRIAPFVGGFGLTENLGGGRGSKRIVKKDRVVYTVLNEKIIIHSCKKHYDDK